MPRKPRKPNFCAGIVIDVPDYGKVLKIVHEGEGTTQKATSKARMKISPEDYPGAVDVVVLNVTGSFKFQSRPVLVESEDEPDFGIGGPHVNLGLAKQWEELGLHPLQAKKLSLLDMTPEGAKAITEGEMRRKYGFSKNLIERLTAAIGSGNEQQVPKVLPNPFEEQGDQAL